MKESVDEPLLLHSCGLKIKRRGWRLSAKKTAESRLRLSGKRGNDRERKGERERVETTTKALYFVSLHTSRHTHTHTHTHIHTHDARLDRCRPPGGGRCGSRTGHPRVPRAAHQRRPRLRPQGLLPFTLCSLALATAAAAPSWARPARLLAHRCCSAALSRLECPFWRR